MEVSRAGSGFLNYYFDVNNNAAWIAQKTKVPKEAKMLLSSAIGGFKLAELFIDITPLSGIKYSFNEIKSFTGLLEITQTVNLIANPIRSSLTTHVLNVSGLGLFVFGGLNLAEKYHWIDLSSLHDKCAQIPGFGLFPFAGVLKILVISTQLGLLSGTLYDKEKFKEKQNKIKNEKIVFWTDLTREKIEGRLEKLRVKQATSSNPKLASKIIGWEKVLSEFNRDEESVESFRQAKLQKWETKERKAAIDIFGANVKIARRSVAVAFQLLEIALTISLIGDVIAKPIAAIGSGIDLMFNLTAYKYKCDSKSIKVNSVSFDDHYANKLEDELGKLFGLHYG